jgi:hypothetical protein
MFNRPKKPEMCQIPETTYQQRFGLFVDLISKHPEQVVYERVIQPKIDEATQQKDGCFITARAKK